MNTNFTSSIEVFACRERPSIVFYNNCGNNNMLINMKLDNFFCNNPENNKNLLYKQFCDSFINNKK